METEVQVVLLVIVYIISIDLVVDVVVSITPKVVMMVGFEMIFMELVQIAPLLQSLKDQVDVIKILNKTISLNRAWLLWIIH